MQVLAVVFSKFTGEGLETSSSMCYFLLIKKVSISIKCQRIQHAGIKTLLKTFMSKRVALTLGVLWRIGSPSWELELRPLGVATGNALTVTRSEDTYEKTPPVGRRQPMTSLPACHNMSAAGRIHHQLFRLH